MDASRTFPSQTGVALLEALVALLVIAFGVLGIVGIQAASVAAVSDARYRVEATALADELLSRIWAETSDANVLPDYATGASGAELPEDWLAKVNTLPGAADHPPSISTGTDNVVTLTIRWAPPGALDKSGTTETAVVHQHRVVTAINRNPPIT